MLTKIAILGSCVSRDAFNLVQDRYCVTLNIQRNSIKTMFGNSFSLTNNEYERATGGGWNARMLKYNCEKSVPSILKENPADYLLLDMVDDRFPIDCYKYKNEIYYLPQYLYSTKLAEFFPDMELINTISLSEVDDVKLEEVVKNFSEIILKLYSPENIILNKFILLHEYISDDLKIVNFNRSDIPKMNTHILKMYSIFEKTIPNINVIKMPEHVLAEPHHRWGLAYTHAHGDYYKYLLDCIDIICGFSKEYTLEQRYMVECRKRYMVECRNNKFKYNLLKAMYN